MLSRYLYIIVVLAAVAIAAPAAADTFVVDLLGTGDFETIQEGLAAASSGDTVRVLEGTYTGAQNRALDFGGEGILLIADAGPAATVINCEGADRAFYFNSGEDTTAVVHGFTVTNGYGDAGGGGVYCLASGAKFVDVIFSGNDAVSFGGGAYTNTGGVTVFDGCEFRGNETGGSGGGAYTFNSTMIFRGTRFESNTAESWGGGVVSYSHGDVTLRDCDFYDNTADYGGGAYCYLIATLEVYGCTFTENTGTNGGGGIYCRDGETYIYGSNFIGNDTEGQAGGVRFFEATGACAIGSVFFENEAGYAGGAIECNTCDPSIERCTLVRNHAGSLGGGIFLYESSPEIEATIIAFGTSGHALYCDNIACEPTTTNCVIYQNAGGDSLCGTHTSNIFDEDPRFCGMLHGDFTHCANSCCLPDNNPWDATIGAHGEGCPDCDTPVSAATWGRLKSLYR